MYDHYVFQMDRVEQCWPKYAKLLALQFSSETLLELVYPTRRKILVEISKTTLPAVDHKNTLEQGGDLINHTDVCAITNSTVSHYFQVICHDVIDASH